MGQVYIVTLLTIWIDPDLFTPEQCKLDWKNFYTEHNIYSKQDLENNYEF